MTTHLLGPFGVEQCDGCSKNEYENVHKDGMF
jgi:hypothetical protein